MKGTGGLAIWIQTGPEMYFKSLFYARHKKKKDSNHVQMPVSISEDCEV